MSSNTVVSGSAASAAQTSAPDRVARLLDRAERIVPWLPPLAFLALAIKVTWPWLIKPSKLMMGPYGGDVSSSIAKFDAYAKTGTFPFSDGVANSMNWPDGLLTTPGLDLVSFLSATYLWLGSELMGSVATHGLLGVTGFFLTATVTYLFVRRVTGSTGAGLVAGIAYGFFPHLYLMTMAATTYTHMWLFILPLWGFYELARNPDRKHALLAGAAFIPPMFWTPYFAIHAFAICVACLLALALLAPRLGLSLRTLAWALVPWVPATIVYWVVGRATGFSDAPDRPLEDFYSQAAHPLMYVLPGYASEWAARWWPELNRELIETVPRSQSANLYVGWSVIALAVVGAVAGLRPLLAKATRRLRPAPVSVVALMALFVVVICGISSMPPRILDGRIPMPGSIVFEVAPGLRAGQRFVMPLMAGMAVLAGIGTWTILRRVPGRVWPALIAVALAVLVGRDLYTTPGAFKDDVVTYPALASLKDRPEAPLAHLQNSSLLGGVPQRACIIQNQHDKPIVNACNLAASPTLIGTLAVNDVCVTLQTYERLGLRYVVVEPARPEPHVTKCLESESGVGPTRRLAQDQHVSVWELRR